MRHVNFEIKAKYDNLRFRYARECLRSSIGAQFIGIDHQIDTYFQVNSGRLKLREGNIEKFLIYYEREEYKTGPKQSNVILFKNEPRSSLKEILTKSLGVLVVVDKRREIYFKDNVKFHLDKVKDLGTFVEIESIDKKGTLSKSKLLAPCLVYMDFLHIEKEDLVSGSYSDLLLNKLKNAQ